jgi:hypothetical protein
MSQLLKRRFLRLAAPIAAPLAALALAACATPRTSPASAEARPALWQIADEDTNIYLFGTIHALPEGAEWRTPAIDQAIAASSELVTEVKLDNLAGAAASFMRLAMAPNLPPVLERVPAGKRAELRAALESTGLPLAAFDRMKDWAVAVTLAQALFQRAGIDPEHGVERNLTASFTAAGRPLSALETAEEQFGFLDSLPAAAQRLFLESVLESPEEVRRSFDEMLAAWRSGDTDAIAETFNDDESVSPELREILLTRRNARWAEWLHRRLDQPGTILVAVGAGHLAGPDSVQAMLQRRGIRARRVQ